MKQRKSWLWIVATLMIAVLCTAGCALADRVTDPHLQQVRKDEQLFRRLGAKGNRDSSVQWDESILLLTETQVPSLGKSGVYTVTYNPPKDTTVVSMRAYLLMRDYSDDYTAVYLLEKEGSVDTSFTTAEIVSEGYYSVVVFVTFADSENNESTYAYSYDYEIGNAAAKPQLSQKIAQVVNSCRAEDAWQTALNLHDWLTNNAYYDLNYEYYGVDGVLLRGYGVCDSYSKAYQMLCDAAGVPVSRVTGWAGESHAWNAIEIDGEWYYVDVTWDDPAGAALALSGEENRDYFCLNDDLMSLDHTKDEGVFTESCTSLDANWMLRNTSEAWSSWGDWNELGNNYFSEGLQQYSEQIREQLAAGAADSFTVPCEDTFAVITGENDGRFEYYEYPADEAPAIRGWTLLGEALSRASFGSRTAAVTYDRVNNCFAVEPNGAPTDCSHPNTREVTVLETDYIETDDDIWHDFSVKEIVRTVCDDCGEIIDEGISSQTNGAAEHEYTDGVCDLCGHACSHDFSESEEGVCGICGFTCGHGSVTAVTGDTVTVYEWISQEQHVKLTTVTSYDLCDLCGSSLNLVTETTRETGNHEDTDTDGICDICGTQIAAGWEYEYVEGERMLNITGTGAVAVDGPAPWLDKGYDIGRVMVGPGITSVGPGVFAGLTGRVRIDFSRQTMPSIDPDAFGTTSVVCRHTSSDESWPADGSTANVTWAWMPTFNMMAAGTFSALSYGEEDGWAVTVQSTNDHCTGMSPETAHEVLLECYDLYLYDLPDADDLETVIGDLEGEYWMLNAFWNGDTPEALTLNGNGIACATLPREILVSSDNVVLNVTDPRTDGIHRVEVQEGTLNYTGNIETLVLTNTGEGNTGTVSVTGTIGEVAYYGADTNAPFFGTLTVTGSVQGGLVYGGEVIMSIPGVTDSYPMGSAPGQTFSELKDLAAAVVIDTDATPVVAAELEGMTAPTVDQFTLRYMLGGGNVLMLTPLEGSGLGSEPLYVMIDNYNEHFMDNLTDNIVWGSNTEIFLGMPEGSNTVTLTGKDGKGVKELGTGDWTTAIVKCPVNWLYFQPDPWDHGSINLTIEGCVNNAYLQPNNCDLNITLRNGGSIGEGRWKQLLRDYRNFDSHSAPEGGSLQLVKDSALMVMSWTYAEALGAILPPDTVVGAAAGVDHAMATLTESSVDALSAAEMDALGAVTDGEDHFLVGISQIISVFDVSVNEYTVDETGNAAIGRTVSELSQPIPVTVTNDSEETDVFVVRLHDEDGAISAVKLDAADAGGGKQFESDRFSTYLLVSGEGTTITGPVITFHANNGSDETTTQVAEENTATELDPNPFTYMDHLFAGWTTEDHLEESAPEIVYADGAEVTLTEDLDLYAVWKIGGFSLDIVDLLNPDERTWDYGTINGSYTMGEYVLPIEDCIGASNFGVSGRTAVQIRFEPGEGYAFIGWYEAEVKDAYAQTLKPVTLKSKNTEYEFEVTEEQEWVRICAVVARSAFGTSKFTVPAAMTVIEENAFEGIGATAIIVPKSCTEIKAEAFKNCLKLRKIRLPKDCEIDDTAFDGCNLVIYAPTGGTTQTWAEENRIIFIGE